MRRALRRRRAAGATPDAASEAPYSVDGEETLDPNTN